MSALRLLRSPILWGVLLIAGGVALLVDNLFDWKVGGIFWGLVLLLGGLIFIAEFIGRGRASWWALIPGVSLVGLSATILLDTLLPSASGGLGGMIFLGSIGLGFFLVYFVERNNWWAIIPGGVLITLGLVAFLDQARFTFFDSGSIFFIGLGLTFLLVAVLPTPQGRMNWAFIPAAILIIFGLLISASLTNLISVVGPTVLILAGLALVIRAFWK